MLIQVVLVNATKGYRYGSDEPCEAFTDDVGRLFKACQQEYGRCTGKVYVDCPSGKAKAIGWAFEKVCRYEDTHEPYIQEAWITLHDLPPTRSRVYHHHDIET